MSDPDPQARMRESWREVAERFSALGTSAKERYRATAALDDDDDDDEDRDTRDADASAALKAALDQLVAAGRELGERVADVARDDELRSQAKQTSSTLDDALSATVDLIEQQVTGLFRRAKPTSGSADWDPPAGPPA